VILDIPDGLRLDLLGLVVEIGRIRIVADRAGLLGGLLASLTCGGAAAADRLEARTLLDQGEKCARRRPDPRVQRVNTAQYSDCHFHAVDLGRGVPL
jgi:hypothetical protein